MNVIHILKNINNAMKYLLLKNEIPQKQNRLIETILIKKQLT